MIGGLRCIRSGRQPKRDDQPAPRIVGRLDGAPVRKDGALGYREAKAVTLTAGGIGLNEGLKQGAQLIRLDARSLVPDRKRRTGGIGFHLQSYGIAPAREAKGISDDI